MIEGNPKHRLPGFQVVWFRRVAQHNWGPYTHTKHRVKKNDLCIMILDTWMITCFAIVQSLNISKLHVNKIETQKWAICTFLDQIRLITTPVGLWYLDLGIQEVAQLTGPIKLRPLCWRTKRLCSLTLWLQSKVWPGVNFRRQVLPLQHLELFLQLLEAPQHLIIAAVQFLEEAKRWSSHLFSLRHTDVSPGEFSSYRLNVGREWRWCQRWCCRWLLR